MAILKCKMCGGDIDLSKDQLYGVCDACGSTVTLPKIEDEQRAGLFNRGNDLRIRGEFDKAAAVYERIIEQDDTDAEAHWCLALCKYGIEYVEDPKSGQRILTCHRVSYDLFLNDIDYGAAVKNSDSYNAALYTEQANRIAEIQKNILAISKREKPYDVFICYKESTGGGSRTKDSLIAQEIYYELTEAGYQVFFARITLENALGTEYEPYIFAALNSAKVMLAVGTSAENFGAAWVKNEWSRFLSLMKTDRGRVLIPCYRDMDPYDLPDELAVLQSQDMSKIGFMQDLIRGTQKVLESTKVNATERTSHGTGFAPKERLIQNGYTHMKLKNYPAARSVFDRVAEEYPEDHRGWWGLILCETKELQVTVEDVSQLNTWFRYVKQLAKEEAYETLLSEYVLYHQTAAKAEANKEMAAVKRSIIDDRYQMNQLSERKSRLENEPTKDEETHTEELRQNQSRLENAKMCLEESENQKNKMKRYIKAGFFITVAGFILYQIGINSKNELAAWLAIGALILLILGIALMVIGPLALYGSKKEIDTWRSEVFRFQREDRALRDSYGRISAELEKKKRNIEKDTRRLEKRLALYQEYLAYEDNLVEMLLAQRCAAFGVILPDDTAVRDLRRRVLEEAKHSANAS